MTNDQLERKLAILEFKFNKLHTEHTKLERQHNKIKFLFDRMLIRETRMLENIASITNYLNYLGDCYNENLIEIDHKIRCIDPELSEEDLFDHIRRF